MQILQSDYRTKLERYKTQIKDIQELQSWMMQYVDDDFKILCFDPDKDLPEWYENLKEAVCPDDGKQ
jgi:hypothetical protein